MKGFGLSDVGKKRLVNQDSFYGKNKSNRKESRLKLWTMICGIVIAVLSIAWFVVELLV